MSNPHCFPPSSSDGAIFTRCHRTPVAGRPSSVCPLVPWSDPAASPQPTPHLFLAGPAFFSTIQGPSLGLAGAQEVWQRSQVETLGWGWERRARGSGVGGLTPMSGCWNVPRMGQPPGQWPSQPRVMVRERFRRMTPERLSGPEALRQRLAVIQRQGKKAS